MDGAESRIAAGSGERGVGKGLSPITYRRSKVKGITQTPLIFLLTNFRQLRY